MGVGEVGICGRWVYMYQSIRVRINECPLYEGCPSIGVSVFIPVLVPCSSHFVC